MIDDAGSAFVLHSRPYRESGALVDLFCRQQGRLRVVARGGRVGKGWRLGPFTPLAVGWRGRGDLKTLTTADASGSAVLAAGRALLLGLYVNELLMRLLPEHCPQEALFDRYRHLLGELAVAADPEPLLRDFELLVLDQLGYGLDLRYDGVHDEPIAAHQFYRFVATDGLVRITSDGAPPQALDGRGFAGEHLLAMAQGRYHDLAVKRTAKRLLRVALQPHLGVRPLYSRELFRAPTADDRSGDHG